MRVPLPITAFFIVLAIWAGHSMGYHSASAIHATNSGDDKTAGSTIETATGDTSSDLSPPSIEKPNRRLWLGILAVTSIGLTLMMFTNAGRIPPRMDHTVADVLHSLPQGVCILDEGGKILMVNIAAARLMGESPNLLLGRRMSALKWLGHRDLQSNDPWNLASKTPIPVSPQWMRYRCGDGHVRTFAIGATSCAHPPDSRTYQASSRKPNIVVTLQDVTEVERRAEDREKMVAILKQDGVQVRRHNRRLQQLASTDPLTGCLNRRQFFSEFERIWRTDLSILGPITVLMIDNDKFKLLNDTYGHGIGDEVLRRVSAWLRKALPQPALVCRYGGEEFCALLPDCNHDSAMQIAEALREGVSQIKLEDEPEIRVTVSIGVATVANDQQRNTTTPVQMIAEADRRLYDAKNSGRDRVVGAAGTPIVGASDETVVD